MEIKIARKRAAVGLTARTRATHISVLANPSAGRAGLRIHTTRCYAWQRQLRSLVIVKSSSSPAPPPEDDRPASASPSSQASAQLIMSTATGFYGLMTLAGVSLSHEAADQLLHGPWDVQAALLWLAPLLLSLAVSVAGADSISGFRQLRAEFKDKLIPMLQDLPLWGLVLLSAGAGVGEETIFRGAAQPAAVKLLAGLLAGLPVAGDPAHAAATLLGIAATSVVFGMLHALTPTYFLWATAASVVFGVESLLSGLPAAVLTHTIYDLLALIFVLQQWGQPVWLPVTRGSSSAGGDRDERPL